MGNRVWTIKSSTWYWWLKIGHDFLMLETESWCCWHHCLGSKWPKPSTIFLLSPSSVTNIDITDTFMLIILVWPRISFSLEFYFQYDENCYEGFFQIYFEMVKTFLDETELTLLSEIGITVRRKISGDPDDYTKVEGSANSLSMCFRPHGFIRRALMRSLKEHIQMWKVSQKMSL